MAKPARFVVGTSGSGKHTETTGPGTEGHCGPEGPRFGPGVEGKRVRPGTDRSDSDNGRPDVKGMRKYSEG